MLIDFYLFGIILFIISFNGHFSAGIHLPVPKATFVCAQNIYLTSLPKISFWEDTNERHRIMQVPHSWT